MAFIRQKTRHFVANFLLGVIGIQVLATVWIVRPSLALIGFAGILLIVSWVFFYILERFGRQRVLAEGGMVL